MSSLSDLWASPYQLWVVLGMKFVEGFSFFSLMYILSKYLSDELGFSDVEAGWLFALCNGMQFPFALGLSVVLDSWGVRRMCMVGETLLLCSRLALWLVQSRKVAWVVLLVLYPMGTAALLPALIVAIKRFSTAQSRPYAFGIFYASLNAASLCVAGALNYFRHHADGSGMYSSVLCLGCASSCVGLLCSCFLHERAGAAPAVPEGQAPPAPAASKLEGAVEVFRSSSFWRFMAVILSFVMIRMVFGHLNATIPKWMTREFGEETPYELYIGINPALIIVLVPICTRVCEITQLKTPHALILGALISGLSPFMLACLAPSTLAVGAFIVVFSVGEAIWSPKLLEYTVAVPQEGREGVYVACGSAPLYLAKFMAGVTSGYLLHYYCPRPDAVDSNDCSTRAMWLAIALTTSNTPIILLLFRKMLFENTQDEVDEGSSLLQKKGASSAA